MQIGNASLARTAGGLIAGNVTDQNTGDGVNAATVTNTAKPAESAGTGATPDDPNLGDGFYWFFATGSGNRHLTAAKAKYSPASRDDRPDEELRHEGRLRPRRRPGQHDGDRHREDRRLAGQATASVKLTNSGTAAGDRHRRGEARRLGHRGEARGLRPPGPAPPRRCTARSTLDREGRAAGPDATRGRRAVDERVADLPVAIQDNVAGVSDGSPVLGVRLHRGRRHRRPVRLRPGHGGLDPEGFRRSHPGVTGARNDRRQVVHQRRLGRHAAIPEDTTEIYDPDADSWSTGAADPTPFAGSGSAVLDGKLYVVGGCTDSCGSTDVQVYDPDADSWSTAADYPEPVSWEACGGIDGVLYCAGGSTDDGTITDAYAYDPGADAWTPIADVPADVWGGAYAAANGQLLISGGVVDDSATLTNEGWAYDPADRRLVVPAEQQRGHVPGRQCHRLLQGRRWTGWRCPGLDCRGAPRASTRAAPAT